MGLARQHQSVRSSSFVQEDFRGELVLDLRAKPPYFRVREPAVRAARPKLVAGLFSRPASAGSRLKHGLKVLGR